MIRQVIVRIDYELRERVSAVRLQSGDSILNREVKFGRPLAKYLPQLDLVHLEARHTLCLGGGSGVKYPSEILGFSSDEGQLNVFVPIASPRA